MSRNLNVSSQPIRIKDLLMVRQCHHQKWAFSDCLKIKSHFSCIIKRFCQYISTCKYFKRLSAVWGRRYSGTVRNACYGIFILTKCHKNIALTVKCAFLVIIRSKCQKLVAIAKCRKNTVKW